MDLAGSPEEANLAAHRASQAASHVETKRMVGKPSDEPLNAAETGSRWSARALVTGWTECLLGPQSDGITIGRWRLVHARHVALVQLGMRIR